MDQTAGKGARRTAQAAVMTSQLPVSAPPRRGSSASGMVQALFLVAALPAPVLAADVPFVGIVSQPDATVHSGAGRTYVSGTLSDGQFVRVEQVIQGWYKVEPPVGSYSFISKAFVDARGDGTAGTVNRDRAAVKAPNLKVKGNSYRTQVALPKGVKVTIFGEYGSFYMIRPPPGAYVYVPASAVRRATRQEIRAASGQPPEAEPEQANRAEDAAADAAVAATAPPAPQDAGTTDDLAPADDPGPPEADARSTAADADATTAAAGNEPKPAPSEPDPAYGAGGWGPPRPPEPAPQADEPAPLDEAPTPRPEVTTTPPVEPAIAGATADVAPAPQPQAVAADDGEPPLDEPVDEPGAPIEDVVARDTAIPDEPLMAEPVAPADAPSPVAAQVNATWLAALERRFAHASQVPLEMQPLDQLLAAYRGALDREGLGPGDRRMVAARIAGLEHRAQAAAMLRQLRAATRGGNERLEAARRSAAVYRSTRARAAGEELVGQLLASPIYDGRTLPRLYRLVDTGTRRTVAYVRPGDVIEVRSCLGRLVAVRGPTRWDPDLGLLVLDATRAEVVRMAQP